MSSAVGSSWEGMNPDVVEAQARILGGLSEEIITVMNKIEGEVSQLADAWHGDDSRKFAADWAGTHKPVLTTAAALLQNMSDTSVRHATRSGSRRRADARPSFFIRCVKGIVMAVSQGMNHSAVLAVAGQLDADHQTVTDLMQRASAAVSTLGENWFGNDSRQFAADWAAHSRALQMAADVVAAMSRQARLQASDQQTTSAS